MVRQHQQRRENASARIGSAARTFSAVRARVRILAAVRGVQALTAGLPPTSLVAAGTARSVIAGSFDGV